MLIFDYDEEDEKSYVLTHEGAFYSYMNADALTDLMQGLYWMATTFVIGDELDIWSDEASIEGKRIGLCEIHLVSERRPFSYQPEQPSDRLDIYVTRDDCKEAFWQLSLLSEATGADDFRGFQISSQTRLFDTLDVIVHDDFLPNVFLQR